MVLNILYICYVDLDEMSSGSLVRPVRMLNAFKDEGHNVTLLSGNQVNYRMRKKSVKDIKESLTKNKYDLCYIESPTYPIMLHTDRNLIKRIHMEDIPIGYFYRDFYRRFPEEFPRRTSFVGRIKEYGLDILQWLTDRCLNNCDIVYVPSDEARRVLKYKDTRALPPAGDNQLYDTIKIPNKTGIYVGGITGGYNGKLILDCFKKLYDMDKEYKLILVCRKNEWEQFEHPCKNSKWLEVHHVSGEELDYLYSVASFAICAKKPIPYNDFAISVKVFEYMSHGLPQFVNRAKAISNLMEKEGIGIIVDGSVESFVDAIDDVMNDSVKYKALCNRIRISLTERNMWKHRVRQVVNDLTSKKNG